MPQKYDLKFSPRLLYPLSSSSKSFNNYLIVTYFSSSFHPCLHCFSICFLRISAVVAANSHSSHRYLTSLCLFKMCSIEYLLQLQSTHIYHKDISLPQVYHICYKNISILLIFSSCFSLASGNQRGSSLLFRSKQIVNIKTQIKTIILILMVFCFYDF